MNDQETLVIFRCWRDTEHVGQHGGADYIGVVQATRPVSVDDAGDLIAELTRIGYRLKAIKRASQRVHESRRSTARAIKEAAPCFRDG